jgi:pilus assembly protein Flp/PilA
LEYLGENKEQSMREVVNFIKRLKRDADGASLIEYTVLLAILLVAVIAIITGVGGWILNQWSNLNVALP